VRKPQLPDVGAFIKEQRERSSLSIRKLAELTGVSNPYLSQIERGIIDWMEEQGFESVADFRGRVSALSVPNPAELERSNYVHILDSYSFSPGVMV
jgi:transcriptional regulator with XRE-family HTH domain